MSTTEPHDPAGVTGPIVVLGPVGAGYLAVEAATDIAADHVRADAEGLGHAATSPRTPPLDQVQLYDSHGRALRLDWRDGAPSLVAAEDSIGRGELCALIEEAFAIVRMRAYRDPTILGATELTHAGQVRPPDAPDAGANPPTDEGYAQFFDVLLERLRTDDPADHLGGWWHNLFHR